MKNIIIFLSGIVFFTFGISSAVTKRGEISKSADQSTQVSSNGDEGLGYRVDQPGTITFTTGIQIKGKVEKPQVVIFLPKEKPVYREIKFERSFAKEIMQPLPFTPVNE